METPDTGRYMVAAYALVAVVVLVYAISLWSRARSRK